MGTGKLRDWTLLMTAAYHGQAKIAAYLIEKGARVETRNCSGVTALMLAALSVDLRTVGTLLGAGANANVADSFGMTPLVYAILLGSLNRENETRSEELRRLEQFKIVELLLDQGVPANRLFTEPTTGTDRWTPLMAAAANGRVRIVRLLLQKGAEVNLFHTGDDHSSPHAAIHMAAWGNHLEVARLLLKHKSCVDCLRSKTDPATPLTYAIQQANPAMIELLLSHGARLNVRMRCGTPVTHMSWQARYDSAVLELLVKHGADLNAVDCHGATLLQEAIVKGNTRLAMALIRHRADFTLRDRSGRTALCHARLIGNLQIRRKLEALDAPLGVCKKY